MNFYQLFKVIDAASLGMNDEEYKIILETFLDPDEELDRVLDIDDETLRKRKKRGKNEYTARDRLMSLFSQKYLHHPNEEETFSPDISSILCIEECILVDCWVHFAILFGLVISTDDLIWLIFTKLLK